MALIRCKECGTEISSSAKNCPNCGKKIKHTGLIIFLVLLVIILGIGAGATVDNNTIPTSTSVQQEENTKATLEKFNKIQTGMTYQEVVAIVGEEGTLSTESSAGNQNMKIYYWYAKNGISNMTISFFNDKVNAKSQIGLN